jgi:hypothetical protein
MLVAADAPPPAPPRVRPAGPSGALRIRVAKARHIATVGTPPPDPQAGLT